MVALESPGRAEELNQNQTEEPKTIASTYNSALEGISMDINEEPQQYVHRAQELMFIPITDTATLDDLSSASDDDGPLPRGESAHLSHIRKCFQADIGGSIPIPIRVASCSVETSR